MSLSLAPIGAHAMPSDVALLAELRAAWPPTPRPAADGYVARRLDGLEPVDVMGVPGIAGDERTLAVAVVADASGALAALPCLRSSAGWTEAGAGDGLTSALLGALAGLPPGAASRSTPGFGLLRLGGMGIGSSTVEQGVGVDQTNRSVIVDDRYLVKWRTSPEADGARAVVLRRHLAAAGFDEVPDLLGVLSWGDGHGREVVLADIDAFLPGAKDGYDHAIDALVAHVSEASGDRAMDAVARHLAPGLGQLTARLHLALATPTDLIAEPRADAGRVEVLAWSERAREAIDAAAAIDAPDQEVVRTCQPVLRAAVETLATVDGTPLMPVHGDLHLGQVVPWSGGIALIDFDGPPGHRADGRLDLRPAARDVAQLLCSLDHAAVAADRRTDGRSARALADWARDARVAFLRSYRTTLEAAGRPGMLDRRLLEPFLAEQCCRELIYAAQTLPRWRYAPIGAMRWRYLEEGA